MGMPIKTNTTCDIYRSSHTPPAAPDVAGVSINLESTFGPPRMSATVNSSTGSRWTHLALCEITVDIRGRLQRQHHRWPGHVHGDVRQHLCTGQKNGAKFEVVFVERVGYNSGQDFFRVYLQRSNPTWPTQNL
jgi:hypothetical protein